MKRIKNISHSKIKVRRVQFLRIILKGFWRINEAWSKRGINSMRCHHIHPRLIIWRSRRSCESKWWLHSPMLRANMRPSTTLARTIRPRCRSSRLRIVFSQAEDLIINLFKMFIIQQRILVQRSIFWAEAMLALQLRASSPGTEAARKNDIWAIKIEGRAIVISIDLQSPKELKPEIAKVCKVKTANRICSNQIASDLSKIAAVGFQALDRSRTPAEALGRISSSRSRPPTSKEKHVTPAMQRQEVIQEVLDPSSLGSPKGLASCHLKNPT